MQWLTCVCAADVRELISVDDVMEELKLGPNGGLVYCMEYLCRSTEWMDEVLEPYGDDDYLLFDCPGMWPLWWMGIVSAR